MVFPLKDDIDPEVKDNKTYINTRVGNDIYIPRGNGSFWVWRDYYEGKERKDIKKIKSSYKRVGNDLHHYGYGHNFIIKDYYSYYKKNNKKEKKLRIVDLDKDKATCVFLILLCVVVPLIFPLFKFTSHKINFSIEHEKKEFRAEYPISFRWGISFSISQAFILWGDGTTDDIKKARSGSLEHSYDLQGKYTPTLLVWDSVGKLRSKPIELKIENDILEFEIEVKKVVFEGQKTAISVDNIFTLNKGLQKDVTGLNFVYDVSETQIISNESSISYQWKNEGNFSLIVSVIDSQGVISKQSCYIEVINKDPEALFTIIGDGPYEARADIEFSAHESSDTSNDKDSLQYIWNWGDHTSSWGKHVSHSYYSQGIYNVSLCVLDDDGISNGYSQLVTIEKASPSTVPIYNSSSNVPLIAIGTFLDEVYESEEVQFTSEVNRNMTNFQVLWSFGDGTYSVEPHPIHTYSTVGTYNVVLQVIDSEGQSYTRSKSITVKEKAPEILGPYNFQGVEGQALVLDIDVVDAFNDIPDLRYEWYTQNNRLFSHEKKPTLVLEKGSYQYKLSVTDHSGSNSSHDVNVIIHPLAHEVFVASYMYHGLPADKYDSTGNTGVLKLRAYLHDNEINKSDYDFYWTIRHGDYTFKMNQLSCSNHNEISFKCMETTIYQGEVKVVDSSGKAKVSIFQISSFIDSTHDGINDEYEQMLQTYSASSEEIDEDYDNDHLPDNYEMIRSHTDYSRADSDSDGLYDGYDDSGVGELTLGTDPLNFDTDGDFLRDSIEYYGWDISINYFENRSTFHINSDPLLNDTDYDGLSDYEEFNAGTNPRLADSDCDKLLDLYDPFPTTWDQDNDLLSDFMELKLGTSINMSDSDMDGLKDGEEIYGWGILNYQTSPIYSDSDGDFLDDFAEILNYNYDLEDEYGEDIRVDLSQPVNLHFPHLFRKATIAQISFALTFGEYGEDNTQSYGVQDQALQNLNIIIRKADDDVVLYDSITNSTRYFSYIVDITEIMNDKSLNYYGDYVIEVKDLNNENNVPKCILEQFEIQISRYLNPNDEDTDKDGIFDGVEMGLIVEGIDKIDFHDFYNSTVTREDNTEDINEFFLEIPSTGRCYDGNLIVDIQSENVLLGSGNISIQIIKQHVNHSIEDTVLLNEVKNLEVNHQFGYYKILDISQYIDLGIIPEYYGKYFLKITIRDSNTNDNFFISEFYIETETYVQAGPQDSHAWITDPDLEDSDEDGWSDSYEIFTSATNPINKDTDGDSAWDPIDRDPFRNIMIEIRPISATFANQVPPWPTPKLEIIIQFQLNDLIDSDFSEDTSTIGFCTTTQHATTNPTWWGAYQTAWWTDGDGHHYYYDISDDITIQSNTIPFSFQLWQMLSFGDVDIFHEWLTDTYSINDVGHFELLLVEKNGDKVRCIVETIAIEKANTIAIFNPNSTDFTGHYNYNEQEQMNIIQLHITGDCDGTPFNPGPNMIIIPTSLFTKTLLNSYFQKEQLDQTPLYSSETGLFECYSIDRDGSVIEDQCGDSDMVFIRYNITAQDALEILESLLICVVNETTNEQQKVLDCVSTKLNGTKAVTLNLPQSILLFIPWIADIESSPFGRAPVKFNFLELFTLMLLSFLFPVLSMYLLVKLTIAVFSALFKTIADTIGMVLLTFLDNLLWIVIRTALLVFFYVLLAIELLTNSLLFIGVGLLFSTMSAFSDFSCKWSINWSVPYAENTRIGYLELEMSDYTIIIESNITWIYWDYFDLYIPLLKMNSDIDSLISALDVEPEEPVPPELACGWDHLGDLRYDFHVLYRHTCGYPPEYVKLVLIDPIYKQEHEYLMEVTPGQEFDNYCWFVRFNYTIDFESEFDLVERQGQWYYYFISEASEVHTIQRWPYDGFAIGPLIDEIRNYLISSYQYPYSGNIRQDFTFEVMGADLLENQKPTIVRLNILWPDQTIKSFLMAEASIYTYNETDYVTYEKVLNFSDYISINDRITLKYYFDAVFSDGKISTLWDYEDLDGFDEIDDELANYTYEKCWFEGPTIYPVFIGENKPPVIREWYVQDFIWKKVIDNTSLERVIYPVLDETVLRFYVYIEDPDGTHEEHYKNGFEFIPKLILTNLDNPNSSIEMIDMKWTGGHYGPGPEGYEEYFVDLIGAGAYAYKYDNPTDLLKCDFGPGAWKFSFQVADNQSHTIFSDSYKKIWHVGSLENMKNTLFYGVPIGTGVGGIVGSIIVSVGYTAMALLASSKNHYLQAAAQIVSVGLLIFDFALNIYSFSKFVFETGDTGSLLGLGFNLLLKSCGFLISLLLSKDETGRFNFNFLSKFSGLLMAFNMILLFNEMMNFRLEPDENGDLIFTENQDNPDFNELLGGWPMTITSFLISIVGLTSSLFVASGFAKFGGGSDGVSKIIIFHTILSFAMSALCFVVFLKKSGFFHIAGDLLYMNALNWRL